MRKILAAVAFSALALMACSSDPKLERGEIIEKDYDDPDSRYIPGYSIDGGQTCTGGYNGVPRSCYDNPDTQIPPRWEHEPERFVLTIQGPHPDEEGKTITNKIEVPESVFSGVSVGDWIEVDTLEIMSDGQEILPA